MSPLADARAAVSFLTRIPAHDASRPFDAAGMTRAAAWFPAVGLLVGAVMGVVHALAGLALDPGPATVLALLAAVGITGGLHEDGLADVSDGMGARVDAQRRLEIFKDSRVGTYGALAVVFMVLFAYTVLVGLDDTDFLRAALVGHVLGRWSTLPQSWLIGPATPLGSGTLVRVGAGTVAVTTLFAAAVAIGVGGPAAGGAALATAVLLTALGGAYFRRGVGGVSGDTFGAVNKVVELGAYAALVAVWS